MVQRIHQSHTAAGDGSGTGAAVSLDDIAVDSDAVLTECFHINGGPQGATNQALDFNRAATLFAPGGFTAHAAAGRAGQHAIFGGDPALALAAQKRRHFVFHRRCADDFGIAKLNQYRALGMAGELAGDSDVARLFWRSSARSHSDS